jgi:NAD(P)-dependent dehydrogenase (short-subunit alcohol dehydrogenase family)
MTARPIAVVTGASAGVGRATVRELAAQGFDVALLARGAAGLEAATAEVELSGARAFAIPTDVSRFDEVDAAACRIEQEFGPIDVWINNAMTTVFAPLAETSPADFQRALEVTVLGQVWGTTAALARMRPRDAGVIVNVGSALAFVGIPLQAAYCASKFACRGFFESARAELLHDGSNVRLSMVHLPAVNTPQFDWCKTSLRRHPKPVPPIYQPEIAARHIVRSALDGRRSRIVGSWTRLLVMVDSLVPGVGNQFAALAAWDAQLTDQPIAADRPVNLSHPADEHSDHGAHGIFDGEAGGVTDATFLRSLPQTARLFAGALRRDVQDRRRRPTFADRADTATPIASPR